MAGSERSGPGAADPELFRARPVFVTPCAETSPDHVARELEYMYYLAFKAIETYDTIWSERLRSFWLQHLGQWLPAFARDVRQANCHTFYTALAHLIEGFCVTEQDHWSAS